MYPRPLWFIDTNVLVSAALTPGGVCDQVLQHAVAGDFTPAWNNLILTEYRDVLARPRFCLSPESQNRLLESLPRSGFIYTTENAPTLPDSDDGRFLVVALATQDKTIVTGNPRHFPSPLMKKHGVTILSPRQAVLRLSQP